MVYIIPACEILESGVSVLPLTTCQWHNSMRKNFTKMIALKIDYPYLVLWPIYTYDRFNCARSRVQIFLQELNVSTSSPQAICLM